jgi:isoleucyl-tRNA synthetase
MAALDQQQIAQLEKDGTLPINVEGQSLDIDAADVEIISEDIPGWLVANEGNLTVALEVTLTEELVDEGMARELVKRVQKMRKDGGLEITDRIQVVIDPAQPLVKAMEAFGDYVKTQVLADEVTFADNDGTEVDFEDFKVHIQVKKSN